MVVPTGYGTAVVPSGCTGTIFTYPITGGSPAITDARGPATTAQATWVKRLPQLRKEIRQLRERLATLEKKLTQEDEV